MERLLLAACFFIIPWGGSQGLTIHTDHSQINVTVGGHAFFSVRPSEEVKAGNWVFKGATIATWIGSYGVVDNAYDSRAELFLPNGSFLLNSVTTSDSGDYTVSMSPKVGDSQTATIALLVLDKTSSGLSAGAIAGIVIGVIAGAAIVCGSVAWFVKCNSNRGKVPERSDTKITAGRNNALSTNAGNSSQTYENIPRSNNPTQPVDETSTYMGLNLEDRSVYSDLKRYEGRTF